MKQAWQSVASVARSNDPLQHRPQLDRRADEVDHPVQGPVLFAKPTGLRGSRQEMPPYTRLAMCEAHILDPDTQCPRPLPDTCAWRIYLADGYHN